MASSAKRSPTPERAAAEDPDTAAARKELRQTAISEKPSPSATAADSHAAPSGDGADTAAEATTPERLTWDDSTTQEMASPKKKRGHDEVDKPGDVAAGADADGDVSPVGANGSVSLDRSDRSEPEKKRPRDVSSESKDGHITITAPAKSDDSAYPSTKGDKPSSAKPAGIRDDKSPGQDTSNTTASAFKSSGMSSFATQASPFLQAGTGQTSSIFASSSSANAKSIFSGGSNSSNGIASPFGQVNSSSTFGGSTFGSSTFGGFGGSSGGSRSTIFSQPGGSLKSGKPAKPFGAPVSESEDDGEEEEDGNASGNDKDDAENQDAEEDKAAETEDKKKPKLQRVAVDDGEAGEAAIFQVRGKLYHLDKASNSWKERGAGNLKINVPLACVRADDPEAPLSGTFDVSALKNAESKVARLLMRQDSTHRVILNTAIIPTMKFQEKSSLKATYILFTAIEGEGAVSIQIKMNATNARGFLNEVESLQRQLQAV
ncbi:hypothetical protein F4802DRAFT_435532 [Xylaria palmicola]|nr:hypothetical protein F4802DRAFT_435532 [Xylaria palmicola]